PHYDHLHAEILRRNNSLSKILVAGDQICTAYRPLAGKRHQVAVDEGIDTLLLSVLADPSQANLHVGKVPDLKVVRSWYAIRCTVIPIQPQWVEPTVVSRQLCQLCDQRLVRAVELGTTLCPADDQTTPSQEVAGIYEDGALIHETKRARKSGPNKPPM